MKIPVIKQQQQQKETWKVVWGVFPSLHFNGKYEKGRVATQHLPTRNHYHELCTGGVYGIKQGGG